MTNLEKFNEVFGEFKNLSLTFWLEEYKEPEKEKKEKKTTKKGK